VGVLGISSKQTGNINAPFTNLSSKYRPVCTCLTQLAAQAIHLGQAGRSAMEARYLGLVCRLPCLDVDVSNPPPAAGKTPKESQANYHDEKANSNPTWRVGTSDIVMQPMREIYYYSCRPHLQRLSMLLQSDAICTQRCMRRAVHIKRFVDTS